MTEITRVPIQPIAKGSLTKLWLGVAAAVALGAGLAWAAVPAGVAVETVQAGTGDAPKIGDVIFAKYTGKLPDGTVFDESQPLPLPPGLLPEGQPFLLEQGQMVDGFFEGLQQVRKGGKYRFEIPAAKAYGASPPPNSSIPPNSDLVFEIEVTEIMSRADAERRFQAVQQMMQMQQEGQGGARNAQPGAGPQPGQPMPPQDQPQGQPQQ